jgi:hypothetical protein
MKGSTTRRACLLCRGNPSQSICRSSTKICGPSAGRLLDHCLSQFGIQTHDLLKTTPFY